MLVRKRNEEEKGGQREGMEIVKGELESRECEERENEIKRRKREDKGEGKRKRVRNTKILSCIFKHHTPAVCPLSIFCTQLPCFQLFSVLY
jgi:hypothetical protein